MGYEGRFDVIVVGGGHAGIEAALVPARLGYSVLLLTLNIDTIGQMSCNPSIGGLAKGHLVKEVDVLGGQIGILADQTAVQCRILNRSKGPAVWSPRSQNDRLQYKELARKVLEKEPNIIIKQEEVSEILVEHDMIYGVRTAISNEYKAKVVILTTGTFLNGLMHIGLKSFAGGRLAEAHSSSLSDSLKKIGLALGRLKTGTSPRIAKNSIDTSELRRQDGDEEPFLFSFRSRESVSEQLPCYITHTNRRTHEIIKKNLDRSPLYTGKIIGTGPRYCPSIETKVVRFADRDSHLVFIEPEGRSSGEFYLNGLATSLPYDVQIEMLHTIQGLENVEITRPGYAVEYDFVFPIQLYPSLETKIVKNLFCAGQINGTSGYEEAAAQGFMAGINAVLKLRDEKPFILKRYEAYIGVLIDDLTTKNTEEPYRMFTSLAEHRLLLRIDNVADRLMHYGVKYGLIKPEEYEPFKKEREEVDAALEKVKSVVVKPETANPVLRAKNEKEIPEERGGQTLFQLLKRPGIHYQDIMQMGGLEFTADVGRRLEIETKYEGYIKREEELIERLQELERVRIPRNFSYSEIKGLSNEAKSKLNDVKPVNLDQASRIQGIGPSDILLLLLHLKRNG
ncbi:MAG TPA: tRNA uridine-5-carboxymethylaminomethyl(34) synthesis enzyme MnmG [candidate division WOR-3 bacterium]|uniref:tRNA uridine 5-carboxymethylaminomethyl modification enzyme MnmG n=1 Tax=candidate division WOR-3 bacterium TaxID=2052148 RepID=A0A9C9EP57_UNCW3|nr:tRNA uridine-5-carboxymethylaminomethyl(34) synthesis enzyme MnmG [candidate division WOR-3 bacterium]